MAHAVDEIEPALFRDRREAGRRLAEELARAELQDPVVLALPRGGVPVGYEVARSLRAPLDVIAVRKIGAPLQSEYGIGAIAEGGIILVNPEAIRALGVDDREIHRLVERERAALERRQARYRRGRGPVSVEGRTAVIVDDGLATGVTAVAAARAARGRGAGRVVLAVPVGPPGADSRLTGEVDDLVCLHTPRHFFAVGVHYRRFGQVSDEEVERLLAEAAGTSPPAPPESPRGLGGADWSRVHARSIEIDLGGVRLAGDLRVPPGAVGLVLFAHGSGSSRHSRRNIQVATALNGARVATLLFDLLTEEEAVDRRRVFDIGLLAERLTAATRWAWQDEEVGSLACGYFGASTGAAAALRAAAELDERIGAIVSRGGRPDLAEPYLTQVTAPTLLIVGADDWTVLQLNDDAATSLRCEHRLEIVPHASHLFEEPGALEQVAALAVDWFTGHLRSAKAAP